MTTYALGVRRGRLARGGSASQVTGGALLGLIVAGVTAVVVSDATVKAAAVLIVVAGTLWFAFTRRTQLALALLMLYLGLLDGFLKLSTGSSQVTLVRDALLYAIVIGLLVRAALDGRSLRLPPLSARVIAFVVLVLAQLANPDNGSLYHSLAGVRQHLEFVPLFFLAFVFVRSVRSLRTVAVLLVVIATANGAASLIQFESSPAQFAAWGPGYAQRVLGTGNFQYSIRGFYSTTGLQNRPFGLGSDSGDGGLMGDLALGAILALGSATRRRRDLVFLAIGAVAAVTAIVTSEGRAAVVGGVVVVLAYALLTARSRGRLRTLLAAGIVGLAVLFVIQTLVSQSGSSAFRYSGLTGSQLIGTTAKARGLSLAKIPDHLRRYPLGAGLGVAGPATVVGGGPPQANSIDAENEISFLVVETGIPGMVALVGFTVALFALGLRRLRLVPEREARFLVAAIIAPIGALIAVYVVNAPTPTTPFGPYLWAAGGIVSYWLIQRPRELSSAPPAAAAPAPASS